MSVECGGVAANANVETAGDCWRLLEMMASCLSTYSQIQRRDYSPSARVGVRAAWQMPLNDRRERQAARASQIASRLSSNRFHP